MMRTPNCRRPGLSLTEVLVTIFVMALGIISLMTLFPVGAMLMGQGLSDDRRGQTASQADGMVRLWWQTQVVEPGQATPGGEDAFFKVMDNPNYPAAPFAGLPQKPLDNNPSYPVFLDGIGWQARPAGNRDWITGTPGCLPRRSAGILGTNFQATVRSFSMMDDITFNQTGTPDKLSGSTGGVVREGAYNWCAVIQRPNNANRYVADFKVLVFHTKGLYGGHVPGTNPAGAETIYTPASAVGGSTQVVLNVPIANLPLRSGSWILDGTNSAVANFYRIQSITEIGPNTTILELDTPLKSTATQIYVIKGLADVFDRPQLTNSGYQKQAP